MTDYRAKAEALANLIVGITQWADIDRINLERNAAIETALRFAAEEAAEADVEIASARVEERERCAAIAGSACDKLKLRSGDRNDPLNKQIAAQKVMALDIAVAIRALGPSEAKEFKLPAEASPPPSATAQEAEEGDLREPASAVPRPPASGSS